MSIAAPSWESVRPTPIAPVADITDITSPKVRHLYEWWIGEAGGGVPQRRRFDITQHREIVSQVSLADVLPGGLFQRRVLGSQLQFWVGEDRTGTILGPENSLENDRFLYNLYSAVAQSRVPLLHRGRIELAHEGERMFEALDCPLADDEGRKVVAIIGVLEFL